MNDLPYPVTAQSDVRTHWEGCYREKGHHNCAVAALEQMRAANGELWIQQCEQAKRVEQLEAVLREFVNKLDECQPHIDGAFQMAFNVRGHKYAGPTYEHELKAARALVGDRQ